MSCMQVVGKPAPVFPYWKWSPQASTLAKQYKQNSPIPHILLRDFLDAETATQIAKEFPHPSANVWTQYKHVSENKMGLAKRELFPARLGDLVDELNSPDFVSWLSELTGIPNLTADPSLEGGGLHQAGRDGFLNVHTDFSHHHYHKNWRRRVNLILYLNPEWHAEWGGALELWDVAMKGCVVKYPPLLNHALIFNTDERSLHGFPEPLKCPDAVSRKSLALYYYTTERESHSTARSTNYHARPNDGRGKAAMIWLDKQALNLYSRAKARFGFSDEFASKVLGFFSGKK